MRRGSPKRRLGRAALAFGGLALAGLVAAFTLRPSAEAYRSLAVRAESAKPGQLTVRFLGTSTLAFDDGQDVVLIDGYLSRPGIVALLTRPLRPDQAAIVSGPYRGAP